MKISRPTDYKVLANDPTGNANDHDAGMIAALRLLDCPCSASDAFVRGWTMGRRIARTLIANGCHVTRRNGSID